MNALLRTTLALAALFVSTTGITLAKDTSPTLPAVEATLHVFTCNALVRPSQAQVAAWSGQSNHGQVYATRQRLMTDVSRLCKKPSVGQVHLVNAPAAAQERPRDRWVVALRRAQR